MLLPLAALLARLAAAELALSAPVVAGCVAFLDACRGKHSSIVTPRRASRHINLHQVVGRPADASRYFTIVDAKRVGRGQGDVWTFARTGAWPDAFPGSRVTARLGASSDDVLREPATTLLSNANLSHNFGIAACDHLRGSKKMGASSTKYSRRA